MRKFLLEDPVDVFLLSKMDRMESSGFPELPMVEVALQTIPDSETYLTDNDCVEGETKASTFCAARRSATAGEDRKVRWEIIMVIGLEKRTIKKI